MTYATTVSNAISTSCVCMSVASIRPITLVVWLSLLSSNRKQFLYFWRIHHMPQADSWFSFTIFFVIVVVLPAAVVVVTVSSKSKAGDLR